MFNMKYLLLFNVFLIWYGVSFTSAMIKTSPAEMDFTYELEKINGTCGNEHKACNETSDFRYENFCLKRCICNRPCVNLRACCFDSPFRSWTPTVQAPSCKKIDGLISHIFVIEKCPPGTADFRLKRKCEIDWTEDDEDYLLLVPVVSFVTNMTYKNYYCFRCNEDHDERVYWSLRLSADIENDTVITDTNFEPIYDRLEKTWLAPFGSDGELINVSFRVEAPKEIFSLTKFCLPNVISDCPDTWENDEIRYKCKYLPTLLTNFTTDILVYYKNPYCALCNYEDLNQKTCYPGRGVWIFEKAFSFSLLLDINRADGDKVGKIQKCDEYHIWDPHFNRCRAIKCAFVGYVVKESKCVKKD